MSEDQAAADFVKALGQLQNPGKTKVARVTNKEGKFLYNFEYADLASILDCVRPVLAANNLALLQPVDIDERITISTQIVHSTGRVMTSSKTLVRQPATPQEMGSIITYMRRYALVSILGIAADEDDDGAAAAGGAAEVAPRKPSPQPARPNPQPGKPTTQPSQPPAPSDDHQDPDYAADAKDLGVSVDHFIAFVSEKTGSHPRLLEPKRYSAIVARLKQPEGQAALKLWSPNGK